MTEQDLPVPTRIPGLEPLGEPPLTAPRIEPDRREREPITVPERERELIPA